jgi:hypothetical protein
VTISSNAGAAAIAPQRKIPAIAKEATASEVRLRTISFIGNAGWASALAPLEAAAVVRKDFQATALE